MKIHDPLNINGGNQGYRITAAQLEAANQTRGIALQNYSSDKWAKRYYDDVTMLLRECEELKAYYENEQNRREHLAVLDDVTSKTHGAMTNAGVPMFDMPDSPPWSLYERVKWLIARLIPADDRYS